MELRDLRYFCTTAELEHVTKAAERLNIAQPYLTRVIHQIEEDIGGELFDKDGRRIKLNANGRVFYHYAKRVLADMDRLHAETDYLFDIKRQNITLLCNTETFSKRLVTAFYQENPSYSLSILNETIPGMIAALGSGEAQFAISSPPIHVDDAMTNIETIEVFHAAGCVVFPPNHPLLAKEKVTIDDLRNERVVAMARGNAMRNRLATIFEEYDYRPNIVFETNSYYSIVQAVQSGLGYAFVTEIMLEDYPEIKDFAVPVDIPDIIGYYGLSYNKTMIDDRNNSHFKAFVLDFLTKLQKEMDENSILRGR